MANPACGRSPGDCEGSRFSRNEPNRGSRVGGGFPMPDLQTRIATASALFLFLATLPSSPLAAQAQVFPVGACVGPVGGSPPALVQTCATVYQGTSPNDRTCQDVNACALVRIDDATGMTGNVLDTASGPIAASNNLY